jgi:hypothetical protein
MPKYLPIAVTPVFKAGYSNLMQFRWADCRLAADFAIPEDSQHVLRVQFERTEIVRIVEEMPISTEHEDTPNEGIVVQHLAYLVEGASFWNQQSQAFKDVYQKAKHYRFFTGFYCLDVIATDEPTFTVASKNT